MQDFCVNSPFLVHRKGLIGRLANFLDQENGGMREFLLNEDAPTFFEYALLVALIAIVAIAGITLLGSKVGALFTDVNSAYPPP